MSPPRLPEGWDAARVLQHYQQQTDEEAIAEDEATYEPPTHTAMEVPVDLVPTVSRADRETSGEMNGARLLTLPAADSRTIHRRR